MVSSSVFPQPGQDGVRVADQRHFDDRLLTHRGGEADLRGVVSSYSEKGGRSCLRLRFPRRLLPQARETTTKVLDEKRHFARCPLPRSRLYF